MGISTSTSTGMEVTALWNWQYASDYWWLVRNIYQSQSDIELILFDITNANNKKKQDVNKQGAAGQPTTAPPDPPNSNVMSRSASTLFKQPVSLLEMQEATTSESRTRIHAHITHDVNMNLDKPCQNKMQILL
jgi:hypothetical protein